MKLCQDCRKLSPKQHLLIVRTVVYLFFALRLPRRQGRRRRMPLTAATPSGSLDRSTCRQAGSRSDSPQWSRPRCSTKNCRVTLGCRPKQHLKVTTVSFATCLSFGDCRTYGKLAVFDCCRNGDRVLCCVVIAFCKLFTPGNSECQKKSRRYNNGRVLSRH